MDGLTWIGLVIVAAIAPIALLGWLFEWQYRRRPGNALTMDRGEWHLTNYEPTAYQLKGEFTATNTTEGLDIFIAEVKAELTLLSGKSLSDVVHRIVIRSRHPEPNMPSRNDNYWEAYIVKAGKSTAIELTVDIRGKNLTPLEVVWMRLQYVVYGPEGRQTRVQHAIIPLQFPEEDAAERWRPTASADVLPIRTHLLTPIDRPADVIRRYVLPHARPGDIVTIGESPIAIMQGRFHHPSDIRPGWLAKRLCYYFHPTSSLATACGLQVLVNYSGAWRVAFAFIVGAIAKGVFRIPGVFYRLAGEQARLIDDVTGTLPPYDQFIVLGPADPQSVVDAILKETGLEAAIVDVNDLKRVAVLAATPGASEALLNQALLLNPAGNAAEQTPIVLIRPTTQD